MWFHDLKAPLQGGVPDPRGPANDLTHNAHIMQNDQTLVVV